MNNPSLNTQASAPARRSMFKRVAVFALVGGVAVAGAIGAVAHEPGGGFAFHHHQAMTADEISAHVDKFLQHVYVEVDATDAQKAQIDPLVRQAVTDLMPLHSQTRDFHSQALALLTADRVDRSAIEQMRAEHIQAADQASRRIAQVIGDVAEVLTPAQRKALAARAAEMHGIE